MTTMTPDCVMGTNEIKQETGRSFSYEATSTNSTQELLSYGGVKGEGRYHNLLLLKRCYLVR